MERRELGVAAVGSGRIGTLRATLAAAHPAVRFLAVSDREPERARKLAARVGAQCWSGDNLEVMSRPEVNAVIVSTIEIEHTLPVLQALERGKPVLVEKPIALDLAEADRLIAAAAHAGASLHVGYSRRFKKRYLLAKEQVRQGRLGILVGAMAHVYIPDHRVNLTFLGSGTPGDWALDEFWGPVATETRAWLDHLATGRPCFLATPGDARRTLEIALAIERSLRSRETVRLPLAPH